jgi:ABC-type sugar transport system permease subunit
MKQHAPDGETRLAMMLVAPAVLVVALVAFVPVVATLWESLHRHDLRLPWLGRPLIGSTRWRSRQ